MLSDRLKFAIGIAQKAGDEILMPNYGKIQKLEWKLKTNFKTQVDDESDAFIREHIESAFPDDNIYSEENKDTIKRGNYKWVCDPLDGTIPYTYGFCDHWSLCIGLVREKDAESGVIYCPLRKEMYHAEKGIGAFFNGESIRVMDADNLNRSVIACGPGKEIPEFKRTDQFEYERKLYSEDGVTITMNTGCASVPLAFVARGIIQGCVFPNLEPWDMAAAVIICREAGAKVTDIYGKEWDFEDSSIIAANPVLHDKLMEILYK